MENRQLSWEEYLAILRRRMWWILVPTVLGPVIGYGISLRLPTRYTSQTLVLVEQQKVPDSFVKPVVTEILDERLATMQEQILSRSRLQPIIDRYGLFQDNPKLSMEDKLESMRRLVKVTPVHGDFGGNGGSLPGFYVSYTAPDARLAQQVCGELTSMFMEENLKIREQRSEGTTQFISSQLDDAKRKLDEQDAKLAAFKGKYIGQQPGQEQSNMNMLISLNTQLEANTQAMNQLEQNKTYLEAMLAEQVQAWQGMQSNPGAVTSPATIDQQLAADEAKLSELRSKYTETHPDVVRLKHDIEQLKSKLDSPATAPSVVTTTTEKKGLAEPADVQKLRAQLNALLQAIRDKQREQARIQGQIRAYQDRIQMSPVVEEQYKAITRDHEAALAFYNELLNKRNQSEMATDLEKRQQGEQFRVLDPPNLPEKPTFPKRDMFAEAGLAGGLILGLCVAFILEFLGKAIRNEKDVAFYLQLPVLTAIPVLHVGADNAKTPWFRRNKRSGKSLPLGAA